MKNSVTAHYTHGQLLDRILVGIEAIGKTPDTVTVDELAPVDEFHIGGRLASEDFIGQLELSADDHTLDVGCGIGGTSRFVASRYGCRVTGIDLTPEFVSTGQSLCDWVGLSGQVELHQGDATAMPFADESFNAAFMLHVGMNIASKVDLFEEVYRLIKPGAMFGIYDVMQTSDEALTYPVPWSSVPGTSALATQENTWRLSNRPISVSSGHATAVSLRQNFLQKRASGWSRPVALRRWVFISPWVNPRPSRSVTWWKILPQDASHRSRSSLSSDLLTPGIIYNHLAKEVFLPVGDAVHK